MREPTSELLTYRTLLLYGATILAELGVLGVIGTALPFSSLQTTASP